MNSEKLRALSARIDAMSLRERVFVFAAAGVVALYLVQTFLIDPSQLRQKNAHIRLSGAESALLQIEQQQAQLASQAGQDPDRTVRAALAAQEARLAGLNADLELRERSLVPPARMYQVLKDVVRAQSGVRISGFKTLSPQPVALPDAAEGAPPGFYRHGFEVTVSGRYADLVAYLVRLEALPWQLNWVEASLNAAGRPDLILVLTVHTLSLEEAWLRV
ncbi:MAG: hypothetical protein IV089_02320 [Thiobacillus sp.]|nr:hypothetical protein [Thiobacillus sp.]